MADDGPASPLKRRVPGATGAGPAPATPRALPDALIARMRAAVDAAHEARATASEAAVSEPVTEPIPPLRAAVAAQDWPTAGSPNGTGQRGDAWNFRLGSRPGGLTEPDEGGALDDLAESYLAADPDLAAGYAADAGLDDAGPDLPWPSGAITTSGWDALGRDTEPGTDIRPERAAWWDHAVRSGRTEQRAGAAEAGLGPAAIPPQPRAPRQHGRRPRATAGVVALAVALVAGGGVALALASHDSGKVKVARSGDGNAARIRAAARLAADIASAATWVAAQVSHTAKVACDPVTCRALAGHGIPGRRLDELGRRTASPFMAKIVVDTPALRRQFGTTVAANWAPAVLAGFGFGADRITVRVLVRRGPHAYEAALRADRKQRRLVGASLLTSGQIRTTRSARAALAAGDVDDRLLLAIGALASQDPIDIVAFSGTWPGTSAGIPMRCAFLAEVDPAAYLTKAVYVQAMIGLLRAQPLAYRPVHIGLVRLAGRDVMSVWYPAPSPLGVIRTNP